MEADASARGEVLRSAPRHPHVASGRPHRDRAVSCRKRCRAVPSAAHCLPAPGAIRPSPQHGFRITLHTHSERGDGLGSPSCPGATPGKDPEVVGAQGANESPPTSLLKGGRKATSRIQRAPTLLAPHLGLPVWEWGGPRQRTLRPPRRCALSPQRG